MRSNSADSSSPEESLDRDSQSDEGLSEDEDDSISKETHNLPYFNSDGYAQGQQSFQHGAQNIIPRNEETLAPGPQPELVGHSVANPYYDQYYGGMMAAYGPHLVHPQFLEMQQVRMPLPLEMAQEPVYVNAKQYHAILRRRQSRAKAELEKKLIKDRKPYLHESRHQHAMRRVRSSGGRFAKKNESTTSRHGTEDNNKESGSNSPLGSSVGGMRRAHSGPTGSLEAVNNNNNSSCNGRSYAVDHGGRFEKQEGFIGEGGGGSLGQQWSTIQSNQGSQRAVAMK